jgi:hypothetical protein
MIAETEKQVSGLRILRVCKFDNELCASIIAHSDQWQELIDSIEAPDAKKNIERIVREIRAGLGKE